MNKHPKCRWCGKNRKPSGWEQEVVGGKDAGIWASLCDPCASRRLSNPWNALLPMRKVTSGPSGECREVLNRKREA